MRSSRGNRRCCLEQVSEISVNPILRVPFTGRSQVGLEAWVYVHVEEVGGVKCGQPQSGVLWPPGGAGLPGNLGGGRSIRTQLKSKGRQSGNWKVAGFPGSLHQPLADRPSRLPLYPLHSVPRVL